MFKNSSFIKVLISLFMFSSFLLSAAEYEKLKLNPAAFKGKTLTLVITYEGSQATSERGGKGRVGFYHDIMPPKKWFFFTGASTNIPIVMKKTKKISKKIHRLKRGTKITVIGKVRYKNPKLRDSESDISGCYFSVKSFSEVVE